MDKHSLGYKSPEEIDLILHREQINEFRALLDDGRGGMAKGRKIEQVYTDDLNPFRVAGTTYNTNDYTTDNPFGTGPSGDVVLPPDCMHLITFYQKVDAKGTQGRRIEILNDGEIGDRMDSELIDSIAITPFGYGGQINGVTVAKTLERYKLFPNEPLALTIHYFREPLKPKYAYVIVGREVIFDQSQSQDLEWNEGATNRIIIRALASLGIHLQEPSLVQYFDAKTQSE